MDYVILLWHSLSIPYSIENINIIVSSSDIESKSSDHSEAHRFSYTLQFKIAFISFSTTVEKSIYKFQDVTFIWRSCDASVASIHSSKTN